MKKHVKLISSALVLSLVFALCSCNAGTKEPEKKEIQDAFDRYCKKAEELYGKPSEEYIFDSSSVVNYAISKNAGFSVADYFSDTSNGFTFSVYSK